MPKALITPTYVNIFTRKNYEQIDIGKKRLTIVFEKKKCISLCHDFLHILKQAIYLLKVGLIFQYQFLSNSSGKVISALITILLDSIIPVFLVFSVIWVSLTSTDKTGNRYFIVNEILIKRILRKKQLLSNLL